MLDSPQRNSRTPSTRVHTNHFVFRLVGVSGEKSCWCNHHYIVRTFESESHRNLAPGLVILSKWICRGNPVYDHWDLNSQNSKNPARACSHFFFPTHNRDLEVWRPACSWDISIRNSRASNALARFWSEPIESLRTMIMLDDPKRWLPYGLCSCVSIFCMTVGIQS